jgi:hypothetical protein
VNRDVILALSHGLSAGNHHAHFVLVERVAELEAGRPAKKMNRDCQPVPRRWRFGSSSSGWWRIA